MPNLDDRNRESVKREDPKDREKQGVPGERESDDKYSREGQGKGSSPQSPPYGSGTGRPVVTPGQGSDKGTSEKEDHE